MVVSIPVSEDLFRRYDVAGPRYTSYPTADRFVEAFGEADYLQALAQRPGFVKSRDSLMDVAYDDQVYVDDRTIDSHIKRLRKKFKVVADDFDAIETLYGVGYRYKE